MKQKRQLRELTLKDDFMFGAVMADEENCRKLLELVLSGKDYSELSNAYVIFICDFDPFGEKKYRYTFQNLCLENRELRLKDGSFRTRFAESRTTGKWRSVL